MRIGSDESRYLLSKIIEGMWDDRSSPMCNAINKAVKYIDKTIGFVHQGRYGSSNKKASDRIAFVIALLYHLDIITGSPDELADFSKEVFQSLGKDPETEERYDA